MRLINIGFGNLVSSERLLTIVGPDSAPIKRMIQEARDRAMLIDASYGRKTRAVLLMDTDHVILSAIPPETIARRLRRDPSAEPGAGGGTGMSQGRIIIRFRPVRGRQGHHPSDGHAAARVSLHYLRFGYFSPHAARGPRGRELLFRLARAL